MSSKRWLRQIEEMVASISPGAVIDTSRRHLAVIMSGPKGSQTIFVSKTPSDHRVILNFRSQVRRTAEALGCLDQVQHD